MQQNIGHQPTLLNPDCHSPPFISTCEIKARFFSLQ